MAVFCVRRRLLLLCVIMALQSLQAADQEKKPHHMPSIMRLPEENHSKAVAAIREGNVRWLQSILMDSTTGWTLLHEACAQEKPSLEVVKMLIEQGANVNAINYNGSTPLLELFRWPTINLDIVSLLLSYGASPNVRDCRGCQPLRSACLVGDFDTVVVLCSNNAIITGTILELEMDERIKKYLIQKQKTPSSRCCIVM